MARITFIQPDGSERAVEADADMSVMQAAVSQGVPGILGNCGGNCICATCHVYVEPGQGDRLPHLSDEEDDLLDFAASPRRPESRLGCRIVMSPDLDGLVVRVPESQV